jgi:hypothetical protein
VLLAVPIDIDSANVGCSAQILHRVIATALAVEIVVADVDKKVIHEPVSAKDSAAYHCEAVSASL